MSVLFFLYLDTADPQYLQFFNNRHVLSCDGSLNHVAVEGDDPLEICVRTSGSEGEKVTANVIIVDGTATGMYVLTLMCYRCPVPSVTFYVNI